MTKINRKLVLAVGAIVVASIVTSAAIISHALSTSYIVAGGLAIFLSVLSGIYIVRSVKEAIDAREQTAARLRELNTRMTTLVDAIPDAVYLRTPGDASCT